MKKFLLLISVFMCVPSFGAVAIKGKNDIAVNSDSSLYGLEQEIAKLEKELTKKTEQLNKCAQKNQNFKIAGIATIGLAGAGVAGNISMHSKIKKQEKEIENANKKIADAYATLPELESEIEKFQNVDRIKLLFHKDYTESDHKQWSTFAQLGSKEAAVEKLESDQAFRDWLAKIVRMANSSSSSGTEICSIINNVDTQKEPDVGKCKTICENNFSMPSLPWTDIEYCRNNMEKFRENKKTSQ